MCTLYPTFRLYQSALIASYRNRYFIEYFTRLLSGREREKGIKTKMRVKTAAKILVIAWTLMKSGEMFQGEHLLMRRFGETEAGSAGEQPAEG